VISNKTQAPVAYKPPVTLPSQPTTQQSNSSYKPYVPPQILKKDVVVSSYSPYSAPAPAKKEPEPAQPNVIVSSYTPYTPPAALVNTAAAKNMFESKIASLPQEKLAQKAPPIKAPIASGYTPYVASAPKPLGAPKFLTSSSENITKNTPEPAHSNVVVSSYTPYTPPVAVVNTSVVSGYTPYVASTPKPLGAKALFENRAAPDTNKIAAGVSKMQIAGEAKSVPIASSYTPYVAPVKAQIEKSFVLPQQSYAAPKGILFLL
jgi:hypothetical protein